MMPPEQESNSISGNGPSPNNIILPNWPENVSVHAEPPPLPSVNSNPSPQPDPQQQPNSSKFSVLRESLRPITLKVHLLMKSDYKICKNILDG